MKKLDSISAIIEWLGAILTEIVKGIQNTFNYYDHRKDKFEELVETTAAE